MICEKCGTSTPEDRGACIHCGNIHDYYARTVPEEFLRKPPNKAVTNDDLKVSVLSIGAAMWGLAATVIVGRIFFYLPLIWFALSYLLVAIPAVGLLLILMGKKVLGSYTLIISGAVLIPFGLLGGVMAILAGMIARRARDEDDRWGSLFSGSKALRRVMLGLMVLVLIIPAVVTAGYGSMPHIYISDSKEPVGNGDVYFSIKVKNYGFVEADRELIHVELVIDEKTYPLKWTEGDIGSNSESEMKIHQYTSMYEITEVRLFYDHEMVSKVEY
jgi:hypothetical protein